MGEIVKFFNNENEGSGAADYGNLFLISAVALFIIFGAFQGGMMATVQNVASDFASKFDSLKVADTGRPTM